MQQNAAKKPSPPHQNSITESEAPPTVCACGTFTVLCTVRVQAPVVVQQRASQPCPRAPPVGSRRSSAQFALWEHVSVAQQECPTTVEELNLGHLHVLVAEDHREVHNRREEPARPTNLKKFRRRRPAAPVSPKWRGHTAHRKSRSSHRASTE